MNWKIAVCDDEEIYCEQILKLCQRCFEEENITGTIDVYHNGEEMLDGKEEYHIVFLDVEMKKYNGFEVAKELNKAKRETKIIYITSHKEWMEQAFEVKAFRYLSKNNMEKIPNVMMDAIHELSEDVGVFIKEENGNKIQFILYKDIYALESMGATVILYSGDSHVLIRDTIKSMISKLDDRFIECSRGIVINYQQIEKIENGSVILKNGMKQKISYRRKKFVKDGYKKYIMANAMYR
ncbi:MAG: LytR/AlgR family response regulator transcription factor [Anaerostipes sp.]|jgi:two-component system response regulator LytT